MGTSPSGLMASPQWVLLATGALQHHGAATHLLERGPGADEVQDELVGVLLHPGRDVTIHLGEGRGAVGGVSARAGPRDSTWQAVGTSPLRSP